VGYPIIVSTRCRRPNPRPVREHLHAEPEYHEKLARFLENHDEPRAAMTFESGKHEAAAVITFLSPGLRLFHQGQFEGRKKRISPHLVRAPQEPVDASIQGFYEKLMMVLRQPVFREGKWSLAEIVPAWDGNWTWDCFIAWFWQRDGDERRLVVVNYAGNQSQCYVRLPFHDTTSRRVRMEDIMASTSFDLDGNDLKSRVLYLDLPPWNYRVFEMTAS
jgi:hypothetical protein